MKIITILSIFLVGCAPVPHDYNPTFLFNYKNCDVYKFTTESGKEAHYSDCSEHHVDTESYKFKYTPDEYLETDTEE